jgi:hypothetical protein
VIGISTPGVEDVVAVRDNGGVSTGFSVNGKGDLLWEAQQFSVKSNGHKEAEFALYPKDGRVYIYTRLGSPTRLHLVNPEMIDGNIKIISI